MPLSMDEEYRSSTQIVTGRAVYSNARRFGVAVETEIRKSP